MSKTLYKGIKRFFDIVFSVIFLILFFPLLILASIFIWLTDRGEVFVKEPLRKGVNGKDFRMFKFRTMVPNAHMELLDNPKYKELKKKWKLNGNKLTCKEDSRVTKIGRVLRKTDIDELPQLLNVLLGQMSIVGPRPTYKVEVEQHLKEYPEDKRYLSKIFSVRPGMTGIWQVSGRNEIKLHDRFKMEEKYVDGMNFFTDFKILLQTPFVVLTRKGAYE